MSGVGGRGQIVPPGYLPRTPLSQPILQSGVASISVPRGPIIMPPPPVYIHRSLLSRPVGKARDGGDPIVVVAARATPPVTLAGDARGVPLLLSGEPPPRGPIVPPLATFLRLTGGAMRGVFVRGPIAPPGYSPADESKRGKCGGATRERFTHEQRLAFAESALQLICDKRVEIGHLSEFKQIEAVSKLVKIKGTSSAGVNHNNLWRWTRPDALEELRRLCAVDPSQLNSIGNHKGGRGKCKPGTQFSSRLKWCGWFEEVSSWRFCELVA